MFSYFTTLGHILFWCVLVPLFGAIFKYIVEYNDPPSLKLDGCSNGCIFGLLFYPFSTIIMWVVMLLVMCIGTLNWTDDLSTRKEIPIYSMGVNSKFEINGGFTLGCGHIHGTSDPSYRYFVYDRKDCSYSLEEVYAKNFKIVCTNSVTPKIVITTTEQCRPIRQGFKWLFDENSSWFHYKIPKELQTGIIYIPENSIIQSYRIEL